MKSVVKLLSFMLVAILVPTLVMSLVSLLGGNETVVIIAQFVIMLLMIFAFTRVFSLIRRYEIKTDELIKACKNPDDLRKLRDERITYKSKAKITNELINIDYSEDELKNLRKYTDSTEDMKHYYSALISNSQGRLREEAKIKRDNFNKKYQHKTRIYPDFKENLKTVIKWLILFFVFIIGVGLLKKGIFGSTSFTFMLYIIGLIMTFVLMINSIIWIVRTVNSYWDRKFI